MSGSSQPSASATPRLVIEKFYANSKPNEIGASVRHCIGKSQLKCLDPFVTMAQFEVAAPYGFDYHPHKGFEAVTYMLEGTFNVEDSAGHKATIRPGDVQWLTIGRGAIHSEMPVGQGNTKGVQLWINLPSQEKMMEPKFKEVRSEDIAKAEKDGVEVRVIAGEAMGTRAHDFTLTPMMYLDFTVKPGAQLWQSIPESWSACVFTLEGEGTFGTLSSEPVGEHHVLVLGNGDGVSVWNKSAKPLRFLLIGGQPLHEPVLQHGPFVMNTQAEIDQAIEDFKQCRNGFEKAKICVSGPEN